jgi:hypothetical protein
MREKRVQVRPRRRIGAEEAHGPPAESECLEWKSTLQMVSGNPFLPANSLPCLLPQSSVVLTIPNSFVYKLCEP